MLECWVVGMVFEFRVFRGYLHAFRFCVFCAFCGHSDESEVGGRKSERIMKTTNHERRTKNEERRTRKEEGGTEFWQIRLRGTLRDCSNWDDRMGRSDVLQGANHNVRFFRNRLLRGRLRDAIHNGQSIGGQMPRKRCNVT